MAADENEGPKFAPKCIWCSAPWSEDNVRLEIDASTWGCPSGGYDTDIEAVFSIICHACNREMYRKEAEKSC